MLVPRSAGGDERKELEDIAEIVRSAGYLDGRDRSIDPSVVRGLEYYTGPVYEAELLFDVTNEKGEKVQFGSVGGGGRYDGLVKRFTGQDVPATGFSIGVSRLMTALKNLGKLDVSDVAAPVLVTVMDRDVESLGRYQKMTQDLRNAGIRAEMYQGNPKDFPKQLRYADRRGCPIAMIQGGNERAEGKLIIKDLIEGKRIAATITDNAEWKEAKAGERVIDEGDLVAEVTEDAGGAEGRVNDQILACGTPRTPNALSLKGEGNGARSPSPSRGEGRGGGALARSLQECHRHDPRPVLRPRALTRLPLRPRRACRPSRSSSPPSLSSTWRAKTCAAAFSSPSLRPAQQLCLRPEFTIPVCLSHIADGSHTPARYAYLGEVFRQRRAGGSEFFQAGIEDLGDENTAKADARSLTEAVEMVRLAAPKAALEILLGDQTIFEAVLKALGLPRGWRMRLARTFGNAALLKETLKELSGERPKPSLSAEMAGLASKADAAGLAAAIAEEMQATGFPAHAGRSPEEIAARLIEKSELASVKLTKKQFAALTEFLAIREPLSDAPEHLMRFSKAEGIDLGAALDAFAMRAAQIKSLGLDTASVTYDAAFGRPLDYYTGLVF